MLLKSSKAKIVCATEQEKQRIFHQKLRTAVCTANFAASKALPGKDTARGQSFKFTIFVVDSGEYDNLYASE